MQTLRKLPTTVPMTNDRTANIGQAAAMGTRLLLDLQNADGGWSQAKEMASDAWATGQALYALAHSGIESSQAAISRGQAFLIETQREEGSWLMTSQPTEPGGKGPTSLIPITGGGSAWAVLGLARSIDQAGFGTHRSGLTM